MPTVASGSTVIFDLDGTLVDSARDLVATLNKVIEAEGLPTLPRDSVGHLVGHGALKMLDRAYAFHGQTLDEEKRAQLHKKFLEIYADHLADETVPFEGVLDVLEQLQTDGWLIGVCTNKYEGMSVKLLELLDMTRYFRAVCGSDTFPVRKPDPQHLFGTIEAVGGNPSRTIMVGDSETDINTAKAANIPVIAVTFGYTQEPVESLNPDALVDHYRDMLPAIEKLRAGFKA